MERKYKVKDILGQDILDYLKDQGVSNELIISLARKNKPKHVERIYASEDAEYAKERKKIEATTKDIDTHFKERFNPLNSDGTTRKINKSDPAYNAWRREQTKQIEAETNKEVKPKNVYDDEGQSFLDRAKRGVITTTHELNNIGRFVTGNKPLPEYQKVVEDGRAKDKEYAESFMNESRKKEVEALEKGYGDANSTWDITKAGAGLVADKLTHPKEWNMAGLIAGEAVNPINYVGLGSGGVVGKLALKGATAKMAVGATVGAVGQGALNAGYEYSSEKSLGHSDDEAKKAAILGGVMGAGMGAVMGGFAGAKVKTKLAEKHGENFTKDYNDLLDNELLHIEEVDSVAKQAQPVMEEITKQAKTPDEVNQLVLRHIPPTEKELSTTLVINNNQEVSPRFTGSRVRNALEKSIENPTREPQEMFEVLKSEGFTDETASAITVAYQSKDVTLFDDFVADKMSEVIDTHIVEKQKRLEYTDVREPSVSETRRDEPRGTDGVNEGSATVRGDVEPNAEQTSVQRVEPRDGEASQNVGQRVGEDSQDVGVPTRDETVDGYQTTDADGTSVSRATEEQVVSDEVRLGNKSKLDETEISSITNKNEKVSSTDGKTISSQREEVPGALSPTGEEKHLSIDPPTTKGERKALNAKVEEIIKKPIEETTPQDRAVLEHYTGKGGLESGTKESLTQHYTAPETIEAMYKALDDAKVPIKTALEPAVGSGNFLKNNHKIKFTTVDIDKTNHEVVKRLFSDAEHHHKGYEEFKSSKPFDLVISNVPFSEERGAGRTKHRPDVKALHDHFFIKGLEDVKENGVIAFITSKGVMDKANSKIRKEITAQADVIGAYRLPNSTFKHTHTDVISDVIFLQKRPKGVKSRMKFANDAFETSSKSEDDVLLSDYYRKYGDNILGDMELGIDPLYGKPTYLVTGKADYSKMKVNYKPYKAESQNKSVSTSKGTPTPQEAVKTKAKSNRKSKNELKTELLERIEKSKKIEDVEEYKKKYGKHPFDDRGLKSFHKDDIDRLYELGALFDKEFNPAESFYSKTQHKGSGRVEVTEKSPLLERLRSNENAEGTFDATNATHVKEKLDEVLKNGYAYVGNGHVQNEVLYYSGNIYKKLDAAKTITDMDMKAQIKKLEKNLPKRKTLTEMNFKGNEPWLIENDIKVYRVEQVDKVTKFSDGSSRTEKVWKSEFGKTFDNYLNNRKLTAQTMGESEIAYRRKLRAAEGEVKDTLEEIKQRAMKYQEEIEEVYNRKFNFYKAPDYKKLEYMIDDMVAELPEWFTPRETQKKFVIKALYEGKNINAHDVGGGKTYAGIMLGRVLKQKGIAKKPLYVVPSKVIKNWEKEILELFPDAKIINLGNLDKTTRTKKLFELSNQNADFVLISQEGFKALKLPKEKEIEYTNALMRENLQNSELKGRQKAIQDQKIEMYMKVMSEANDDKRITIDKLGIDAIIADEARAFKNIGVRSSLASKGLGKPFGLNATKKGISLQSALAYDFRFKTKYISEMNNNRNIYMLDATPTPNKPLELFTMLKHLDDKIFDEYNIRTDEDFVNQFLETGQVQDKNGKFKDSITGIKNVFELRSIMDRFIDRISMQEFKDKGYIDIPESKTYKHILEASDESDMVFFEISERLAEAKTDISKRKDVLGIFSNGVSASVDPRLYKQMGISELAYRTRENNKIDAVIGKVIEAKTKDKKAGQIIFVDSAGQNAEHLKYNLHQELKQKLIKEGKYKKEQIAILSGQEITVNGVEKKLSGNKMSEQKQQIVNDYNAGKIKVVIGTTKSAGEGMNIQKFTKDIYHLDLPWTPAEITQRNGRGVRYGNQYKEVNVHYFFTQGSFDDLMFNTVTKKQGWNDLIWDAKAQSHLKIADSDGGGLPSADEIFLSMEKDPIKRKELELGMQHQKLEDELFNVEDEVRYSQGKLGYAESKVTELKNIIKQLKRDIEHEVVDTQSLKELQTKAIKNDKKFGKKFDTDLKQRLETKKRWVKQNEDKLTKKLKIVERAKEALDVAKEDVSVVQKRLDEFEEVNVGDDGKYFSGVEGC